jgi:hypothetical protein
MSDPKWVWWSTHETIQNEVTSVTAILETIIAVPLYWWIALHTGIVLPLLVSAAVAPLVLLRSDESIGLGLRWLQKMDSLYPSLNSEFSLAVAVAFLIKSMTFLIIILPLGAAGIRLIATLCHLQSGIRSLPSNFRRFVLCTSPARMPELVPGIEASDNPLKYSELIKVIIRREKQ